MSKFPTLKLIENEIGSRSSNIEYLHAFLSELREAPSGKWRVLIAIKGADLNGLIRGDHTLSEFLKNKPDSDFLNLNKRFPKWMLNRGDTLSVADYKKFVANNPTSNALLLMDLPDAEHSAIKKAIAYHATGALEDDATIANKRREALAEALKLKYYKMTLNSKSFISRINDISDEMWHDDEALALKINPGKIIAHYPSSTTKAIILKAWLDLTDEHEGEVQRSRDKEDEEYQKARARKKDAEEDEDREYEKSKRGGEAPSDSPADTAPTDKPKPKPAPAETDETRADQANRLLAKLEDKLKAELEKKGTDSTKSQEMLDLINSALISIRGT